MKVQCSRNLLSPLGLQTLAVVVHRIKHTTCMSFSRYLNCLSGVHYNISCSVVIIVMMEHCVRVAVTHASNLEGPSFKSQLEDFFLN